MPDIDVLRDLEDHLRAPHFEELVGVAKRRNRRSAFGAALTVIAVFLGLAAAGVLWSGTPRASQPARDVTPPPPTTEWAPERIRAEGSPGDAIAANGSGLVARIYTLCDGPDCSSDGGGPSEDKHRALEVTQKGRSALFEASGIGSQGPWITVFDEDSVLVEDTAPGGVWPDGPARFRLLQADGTAVLLRLIDDPVPPTPGAATVVIDDFRRHGAGMGGGERVYVVDDNEGTLRPQERPDGS